MSDDVNAPTMRRWLGRRGRALLAAGACVGLLTAASTATAAPAAQLAPVREAAGAVPGWRLVWADEFGDDTVDPDRWAVLNESTLGDGNNELACLMAGNVTEGGGYLTITARQPEVPEICGTRDARFPNGRPYTSGFLETKNKAAFQYGRFEVRFRAPTAAGASKGLWPAFWLRPQGGGIGELDVAEMIGTSAAEASRADRMSQTIHYDYSGTHRFQPHVTRSATGGWNSEFHTAAVEWEPGVIRWYVDGVLTSERNRSTTPWIDEAFSRPFFLRLNLAVGGNWPGAPDADTVFPAEFVIDYVRVYQR